MNAWIYRITSPSNKIYIGSTVNLQKRMGIYSGLHCNRQPRIFNSIKKYGFNNHRVDTLLVCDVSDRFKWEHYYGVMFDVLDGEYGLNTQIPKGNEMYFGLSDEARERIGKANKGKKISDETKRKMSKARKGKKLGYKLKPRTEEQRRNMSLAQTGKKLTEEHKRNVSKGLLGRVHSEETKRKIAAWNKGRTYSKETLKKMSDGQKGRTASEDTRIKMSKSQKGRKHTEESKLKMSLRKMGRVGWKWTREQKDAASRRNKGMISNKKGIRFSEEKKQRIREKIKQKKLLQ